MNSACYVRKHVHVPLACSHVLIVIAKHAQNKNFPHHLHQSQKTASDASWSRSVMNKSHIAAFQSLICGIRTYVKLGNTEVGLHRAQLPCFIFKKHSQLLQASSAGVQREMTRGWLLSTEDPLPFNSLKKKWAGKNGRSVKKVRASHATMSVKVAHCTKYILMAQCVNGEAVTTEIKHSED